MLEAGTLLQNRYKIQERLGQGGMGSVYRAWDTRLNMPVAIKELTALPEYEPHQIKALKEQFSQEASVLARLDHPNLVKVTDFFEEGRSDYLVMNFVEGESLSDRIKRTGALSEPEVLSLSAYILDALAYCHSQGVIHRDIKPANIIIRPDGQPVLVDFGLVKLWDPDDPRTKTAVRGVGTPQYAPPEQYEMTSGHTEPRSDVYSFGATLYHALTGQIPPTATLRIAAPEEFSSVKAISNKVSTRTANAIERAMILARSKRWTTMSDMAKAMDIPIRDWQLAVASDSVAPVLPQSATVKLKRLESKAQLKPRKRRFGWVIAIILVIILGAGVILAWTGRLPFISIPAIGIGVETITPLPVDTIVVASETPTATATSTATVTATATATPTLTNTPTATLRPTRTRRPTATRTSTATATETLEPSPTSSPTPTVTLKPTNTARPSPTLGVPTATEQASSPGELGQIVFTVGSGGGQYLYTTDPSWTRLVEVGKIEGTANTCDGRTTAVTEQGRVVNLYPDSRCELAESVGACASPNGQFKLITQFHEGWVYDVLMDTTQSSTQDWVYNGSLNRSLGVQWSANSQWVMFGIGGIVYVVPGGTIQMSPVVEGFDQDWPPQFSPDGTMILFMRYAGTYMDVYVAQTDGTGIRNVTNDPSVFKLCPRWRQ